MNFNVGWTAMTWLITENYSTNVWGPDVVLRTRHNLRSCCGIVKFKPALSTPSS